MTWEDFKANYLPYPRKDSLDEQLYFLQSKTLVELTKDGKL